MRLMILASLLALLGSCAVPRAVENRSITTYYDRDNDGVVDYELHEVPGTVYWRWALIDSKGTGRYDVRMKLAYPFESERVDLPIPRNVKITPGMPPYRSGQIEFP